MSADPILTPERHPCIDHDARFKGVMCAVNGCLACECEVQAAQLSRAQERAAEDAATIAELRLKLQVNGAWNIAHRFQEATIKRLTEEIEALKDELKEAVSHD